MRIALKSEAADAVKLCSLNSYSVPASKWFSVNSLVSMPSIVALEYSPAVDAGLKYA